MREVVLDTETTGLNPTTGDRIIEIGCVELIDHLPTGRIFQTFVDPERPNDKIARRITGITDEMLEGQPKFSDIVDEFLAFIGDDPLVIHNAAFDIGFLNAELDRLGREPLSMARVVDTMLLARAKFPDESAELDHLCEKMDIYIDAGGKHRALLDAARLAEVYFRLLDAEEDFQSFNITPETSPAILPPTKKHVAQKPKARQRRAQKADRQEAEVVLDFGKIMTAMENSTKHMEAINASLERMSREMKKFEDTNMPEETDGRSFASGLASFLFLLAMVWLILSLID